MVTLFEGTEGWPLAEGQGHEKLVSILRFFEFIPSKIEAQFKFSQNKKPEDIAGVIKGLQNSGQTDVADFMAQVNRMKNT